LTKVFNDIFAIVTAGKTDVFHIAVTGLLEDLGIEYSCCEDVYAATAEFARRREEKIFICRQRSDAACYCLAGSDCVEKILPALRRGVAVANDIKELEQMIVDGLHGRRKQIDKSVHLSKEEIDVVLGV